MPFAIDQPSGGRAELRVQVGKEGNELKNDCLPVSVSFFSHKTEEMETYNIKEQKEIQQTYAVPSYLLPQQTSGRKMKQRSCDPSALPYVRMKVSALLTEYVRFSPPSPPPPLPSLSRLRLSVPALFHSIDRRVSVFASSRHLKPVPQGAPERHPELWCVRGRTGECDRGRGRVVAEKVRWMVIFRLPIL